MLNPTQTTRRWRRLGGARGALGALAALATFVLFAPSADAASYTVAACNSAAGINNSWASYSNMGGSNLYPGVSCPGTYSPGNPAVLYNSGIFVRNVSNTSYSPSGAAAGFVFYAPPGNSLASVTGDWWTTRAGNTGFYAAMFGDWGMVSGCGWDASTCAVFPVGSSVPLNGSSQVHIEVGCKNPAPGCYAANTNRAIFELYGANVAVNDLSWPTSSVSGSLWTGGWQRGTNSVTVAAADTGDGIQQNRLEIDNQLVASQNHGCDYTYPHPCADQTDTFNYATTQLSDGPHTAKVVSYDGAQDSPLTAIKTTTINIDNTAPARVNGVTVAGGEGWHTGNSFGISWTNPSQGNGSPVAAVHYSLCLAPNPTSCPVTNGRVAGTGINSLSGLTVPARGDYLLRVWDEDAAGNVNASTASDAVHLMFDDQAPGAADPAHANGWINAQDAKSYPEPIDLTPGQKTPNRSRASRATRSRSTARSPITRSRPRVRSSPTGSTSCPRAATC